MIKRIQLMVVLSVLFGVAACSWHDDYRSRHPNVLEGESLKTSNESSEHYINLETNQNLRNPPPKFIPGIDDLSKIPDIQDGTE